MFFYTQMHMVEIHSRKMCIFICTLHCAENLHCKIHVCIYLWQRAIGLACLFWWMKPEKKEKIFNGRQNSFFLNGKASPPPSLMARILRRKKISLINGVNLLSLARLQFMLRWWSLVTVSDQPIYSFYQFFYILWSLSIPFRVSSP